MNTLNRQEEFDLFAIFLKLVNIVRANFWLIVIFFLLGTGIGLASYYSATKIYESKMVVSSTILTKSYSNDLIRRLNRHKREMNDSAIMNLLRVSEKTSKSLVYLGIESVTEVEEQKDAEKFIITVEVTDQQILPQLQQGLLFYLENNEFAKVRVEQSKAFFKQMIAKIEAEVADMEDLKRKIASGEFFQKTNGDISFDPTAVNSKIIELTKEKINFENSLKLANSVQLIEGFSIFQRPVQPKLAVSLASGSLLGLFFVGLMIFFKSVRRVLKMADTAQKA